MAKIKHGHAISNTPTYRSWLSMKSRCENKTHKSWKNYGGRGVNYCQDWQSFSNFLSDMGERPDGKTLDRIDNCKGYYPENCKWSTPQEQAYNRRMQKNNSSGETGVYLHRGKVWHAIVCIDGKNKRVYVGPSKEEAISARREAVNKIMEQIAAINGGKE